MSQTVRAEPVTVDSRSLLGVLLDFVSVLVPPVASWRTRNAQRYADFAADARAGGDFAQAESYYVSALDWKPRDPGLRAALGMVYYDNRKLEEAFRQFKRALDLDYQYEVALKGMAFTLHQKGDLSDAMYYYRRYLARNPKDSNALLNLATIFHSLGDLPKAVEYYEQAESCGANPVVTARNHTFALFALGRATEAVPILQHALSLGPKDAELHTLLGNAAEARGDLNAAAGSYNSALQLNPQDANARARLAMVLAKQDRFSEAIEDMRIAVKLYEGMGDQKLSASAWSNLSWYYSELEKYDDAISASTEAIKLAPDDPWGYAQRAGACWYSGQYAQAARDYTKALDLNPQYSAAYNGRGSVLVEMGQYSDAKKDLETAVSMSMNGKNPTLEAYARNALGLAYGGLGDYKRALEEFVISMRLRPNNAWVYYNRALAYDLMGEADKAASDFTAALEKNDPPLNSLKRSRASARLSQEKQNLDKGSVGGI